MKRIKRSLALLVAVGMLLALCACGGKIERGLEVESNGSDVYTQEEIQEAADVVMRHFKTNFSGCTMTALKHNKGGDSTGAEWAETYEADQGMVLTSDFDVDESGGDGSLNPNSTYTGWQWVLVRDEGGSWELKTWGYG